MSEFLLMATLLDIKCRMLLPREVNEEGEEEDPRAELVQKLLEYKAYKYMSYELRDMQVDALKVFYKPPTIPEEVLKFREPVNYEELLADLTLTRLNEIFRNCLKRRRRTKVDLSAAHFRKDEKDRGQQ